MYVAFNFCSIPFYGRKAGFVHVTLGSYATPFMVGVPFYALYDGSQRSLISCEPFFAIKSLHIAFCPSCLAITKKANQLSHQ